MTRVGVTRRSGSRTEEQIHRQAAPKPPRHEGWRPALPVYNAGSATEGGQLLVDDQFERFVGLRTGQDPSVDEEGRRAIDPGVEPGL